MSSANPTRLLFDAIAGLGRVLGNGYRLEILDLLAQGELAVEAIAARTGLGFANASQHLQQLRKAGLVVGRREGKQVVYRLAEGPVLAAVSSLRSLAEHNVAGVRAIVEEYYTALDALEPIGAAELAERMAEGSVTLIDVRPEEEYRAGHIPGAISLPLEQLGARLDELPDGREIVAYCRGPRCILSFKAASTLRQSGRNARRLEDGLPEWRAAGRPVAS
jgi:rhodanese-related sulfurtransferase